MMVDTRTSIFLLWMLPLLVALLPARASAQEAGEKVSFHVKYIAEGIAYLDGGRAAGLKEGQELIVERAVTIAPADTHDASRDVPPNPLPPSGVVARLRVTSVAASSAVCEIASSAEPLEVGDVARLAPEIVKEEKAEEQQERLSGGREYPQLITFTGADPVIDEARAALPRPPTPDVNQFRGRVGVEYSVISTHNNPASTSSEIGFVGRVEMTRIGGTYWSFNGYWRGRFTALSGPAAPATISDLVNRTYTLALEYNNPDSRLVAGVGRLYLPWAASLDTIDGGYIGRKLSERTTAGVFAGTTPDPTSYDYNPNGKLAGVFVNVSGGSFEDWHYSTTVGFALSAIDWHATRQFGFEESSISYKRVFSIYDAMEIDLPHTSISTTPGSGGMGTTPPIPTSTGGLNRSYLTVRYQPIARLEFDLNDTYFRDFPTFDPQLISTGLLDRYLFQGLSGGVRVNLPAKVSVYTEVGKSSASSDTKGSWNQMYGVTLGEIWRTGIRADVRYSKFDSSFGSGQYKVISLSRSLGDRLEWQLLGGTQNLNSTLTTTTATHFVSTYLDWSPGTILFFETGYTWQRGGTMNYDQLQFLVGKRFGGSRR
jgi:hypothetical protein